MVDSLTPLQARMIVEQLGSSGTPPGWGVHLYSVGIDDHLQVLAREYLDDYVAAGGSTFKLVLGLYGGGKTHFLYSVRDLAWKLGYPTAYVMLKPEETPFHDRLRIFQAVMRHLTSPDLPPEEVIGGQGRGIAAFLRRSFQGLTEEATEGGAGPTEARSRAAAALEEAAARCELIGFRRAIEVAARALELDDEEELQDVLQYLLCEGLDRTWGRERGLFHPLNKAEAFPALRSLVTWLKGLGHRGLVMAFDEAEQLPSLSSKQRDRLLSNLREIIDECGNLGFRHVAIFYAVPDEQAFQGQSGVYEALRQRLATVFQLDLPTGVKIQLDGIWTEEEQALYRIGERLVPIFERAYGCRIEPERAQQMVQLTAERAFKRKFGATSYRRLFVQALIQGLQQLRHRPLQFPDPAWADDMLDRLE